GRHSPAPSPCRRQRWRPRSAPWRAPAPRASSAAALAPARAAHSCRAVRNARPWSLHLGFLEGNVVAKSVLDQLARRVLERLAATNLALPGGLLLFHLVGRLHHPAPLAEADVHRRAENLARHRLHVRLLLLRLPQFVIVLERDLDLPLVE